ncbi:MAG: DNA repair protein [Clostridiales bacterium]|nr:DNA repair protein [Clostridiales bacterium]
MNLKKEKKAKPDKNLKKLKREELLELLLEQTKYSEELERQLAAAKKALEKRELTILESGSIAEASLRLNEIFEKAQAAADQYLLNVKNLSEGKTAPETEKEADTL